jgi:hypothetical protein
MAIDNQLLTCPVCKSVGFSVQGLRAHHCDGVNRQTGEGASIEKRRLTKAEVLSAQQVALISREALA